MRKKIIPYDSRLVPIARKLRNNSTLSEVLLWKQLRNRQFSGYDFDRQKPTGSYIVDFYCAELLLVIEIDGCSHDVKGEYDLRRQRKLEELGVSVLRFEDRDVKQSMEEVLYALRGKIRELESRKGPF